MNPVPGMFAGFMVDTWVVATIVALVAGIVGFFVVLRGDTFEAHTLPLGAFPGGAAASLVGVDPLAGLVAFSLFAVFGIALLSRRDQRQIATALMLVMLLGLGAFFLSMTTEYAQSVYALLFGELLGVGSEELAPVAALGAVTVAAALALYRPLLLDTVAPELGAMRGVRPRPLHLTFLGLGALAAATALPVVGALLVFTLLIAPASAARAMSNRPAVALALSACLSLLLVWSAIALAFLSDWPVGFFVGTLGAVAYAGGRILRGGRRAPSGALVAA